MRARNALSIVITIITVIHHVQYHAPYRRLSPLRTSIALDHDLITDTEAYWLSHKSVTGVAEDVRSLCELLPGSLYVEEVVS